MKYATLGLILIAVACKSTSDGANGENKGSQLATANASCEETCAGAFASSRLVGCVTTCDFWRTDRMTVIKGKSLYPLRKAAPVCQFTHTRRDADKIKAGGQSDYFSFAFQYSDGVGDGGFLIAGSGITEFVNLIDFNKDEDKKDIGASANSHTGVFVRQDPKFAGRPTFSLRSKDANHSESKSLVVVLADKFDVNHPFAKITEAYFTESRNNEVRHEIVCGK